MAKNELQEYYQKKRLPLPIYDTVPRLNGGSMMWVSTVSLANGLEFVGDPAFNKITTELSAAVKALQHLNPTISLKLPREEPERFLPVAPKLPREEPERFPTVLSKSRQPESEPFSTVPPKMKVYQSEPEYVSSERLNMYQSTAIEPKNKVHFYSTNRIALFVDSENLHKFAEEVEESQLVGVDIYSFLGKYHSLANKPLAKDSTIKRVISPSTRKDGTDTCIQLYAGMMLTMERYEGYAIATRDKFGSNLVEFISQKGLGWEPKPAVLVTSFDHLFNFVLEMNK